MVIYTDQLYNNLVSDKSQISVVSKIYLIAVYIVVFKNIHIKDIKRLILEYNRSNYFVEA